MTTTAFETALFLVRNHVIAVAAADEALQPLSKATREPKVLRDLHEEFSAPNFIIPNGKQCSFLPLLIDPRKIGKLSESLGALPPSWRTVDRDGREAIWLRAVNEFGRVRRGQMFGAVEVLRYAQVPGASSYGARCEWVDDCNPLSGKLAWLPERWKTELRFATVRRLRGARDEAAPPGIEISDSVPPEFDARLLQRADDW